MLIVFEKATQIMYCKQKDTCSKSTKETLGKGVKYD